MSHLISRTGTPFLRVNCRKFPLTTFVLRQFLPCQLGSPWPQLPPTCISHAVLAVPQECFTCPNQRSLLSLKMRSRSSSYARSSLDLKYCGHILWLDTADLSDHGPVIALQVQLGQWSSFTGMEYDSRPS